jgi:hypothetical protein
MGPALGFDTKQRHSDLVKFGVFIIVGAHYQRRFFACSNEEKMNKNNKECLL